MTLQVVRKDEHHHMKQGWLETYWHFSFSDYFDPKNVSFGPLRVFNDDTVQPGGGWGMHPHRDMEIVTYVVEGAIAHEDSSGGHGVLEAGDIQAMTAGRGIWHAEYNPSDEERLRLVQIWILPEEKGLSPSYRSRSLGKERQGELVEVVSGVRDGEGLPIHRDARIYASQLETGGGVATEIREGRRGYLCVLEGALSLNGKALATRDVVRVVGPETLTLEAAEAAELILADLPST